jgi:GNAT superfamily N-acetyltransferase
MEPQYLSAEKYMHDLGSDIYKRIENPNWAPWLRADSSQLAERMSVFPAGHMLVKDDDGELIGFLSTNRINWDASVEGLTTWDAVAGEKGTFRDTYKPEGNTICLMSMGVAAGAQGQQVAQKMINNVREVARANNVKHIIGDFRPSGYGQYKHMTSDFSFEGYVTQKRTNDSLPLDPWLRNVTRQGMEPLRIDNRAMVVPATTEELSEYMRTYKPESWYEVEDPENKKILIEQQQPFLDLENITHIFECEETGTWYVDKNSGKAVYIESNLWGELPVSG